MTSSASRTVTAAREGQACVYLGLGTNLGDRRTRLDDAVRALGDLVSVEAVSPVYASAPIGFADQPDFWNAVVRVRTKLSPEALLVELKRLEHALGRQATFRNGPREIDIDVLVYDDAVLTGPPEIPHPRMHERAFVLKPLLDLDAGLRDPRTDRPWADYLPAVAGQRLERVAMRSRLEEDG